MARKKPARSEGVAGATRGRRAGHGTAGTVARGTPETVAHGEGRRPSERRGGRRRPIEAGKTCLDDHMLDGQRTTPEHRKTPIANLAGPPEPGANLMRRVCSANPEPSIIRVLYEIGLLSGFRQPERIFPVKVVMPQAENFREMRCCGVLRPENSREMRC